MPDVDAITETKNYSPDIPQRSQSFFLKSSGAPSRARANTNNERHKVRPGSIQARKLIAFLPE
jgi:hypothetical protein